MTAKVKEELAPAASVVKLSAADPANDANVPENTVVPACLTTRFILEQKSVAVPLLEPLFDWVQEAPGVRVKVLAAIVPVFFIVTVVVAVYPGAATVEPPNLLIVEQVAEFVDTDPLSVEVQVTVAPAFCSCMISVPEAAVFAEFVIAAVNPDSVPVTDSDSSAAESSAVVTAIGVKRTLGRFTDFTIPVPHCTREAASGALYEQDQCTKARHARTRVIPLQLRGELEHRIGPSERVAVLLGTDVVHRLGALRGWG